jgi:1,4-alpha-glucan branching enzyme
MSTNNKHQFDEIAKGHHGDPFSILGIHLAGRRRVVRTFQPQAKHVDLVGADGETIASMQRVHADGLFEARMPARKRLYKFRIENYSEHSYAIEDPYRFPSSLGDLDLYLLGEGSDRCIYKKLGAHPTTIVGVVGAKCLAGKRRRRF